VVDATSFDSGPSRLSFILKRKLIWGVEGVVMFDTARSVYFYRFLRVALDAIHTVSEESAAKIS